MSDTWKSAHSQDSVAYVVVSPSHTDEPSKVKLGAAVLLLATRIFYRLGGTVMEGDDGESYETVEDCIAAARARLSRVLAGETITLDGIRVSPVPTPPHA